MGKRIILGAHLTDRCKEAPAFQETITQFGCNIKTRLGLHNAADNFCSGAGLILLEMIGDEDRINQLEDILLHMEGIEVQKMVFTEYQFVTMKRQGPVALCRPVRVTSGGGRSCCRGR